MTKGKWYKVKGEQGVFQFMYERNNELTFYGGDRSPEGHNQWRTFRKDRTFTEVKAPYRKLSDAI